MPVRVSASLSEADSLPKEKRHLLGWETAFRVLPYRMQDQYSRRREPVAFRSIVLENEHLKATFLPELGGRLVSLFSKTQQRELLHRNPVFQPANLAIRNAWFSGGIEWNIAQFGHTFTTCSPLFAGVIRVGQGEPGLRLYEFERCKRLFWQIDFTLPPGFPFLVAYTRVINPNPTETAMYWWTNVAVNEAPDVRVLAPAAQAIYIDVDKEGYAFGCADLPGLPSLHGADGTYALNSTFANEFFFQCENIDIPWEAALDAQGQGFIEASTGFLKYRKLFCWGSHTGGRHWQEFLSQPGEAYLEIQAGLAPTQVHGMVMPAQAAWDWTQVFGYIEADPAGVHSPTWQAAWQTVDAALKAKISPEQLAAVEQECRARADLPPIELLQHGSGWGALEVHRRTGQARLARQVGEAPVSPAFVFPYETLGEEQQKWLALLEQGRLPEQDPAQIPGEWMVQPEWQALLEASLQDEANRSWFALLHLGVMRLESFDGAGAVAAWEESIRCKPSVWAYRNLAVLRLRQKDEAAALEDYRLAWDLAVASGALPGALAAEYLGVLVATRQYALGQQVVNSLPPQARDADRVQILRGQIAMQLGDLEAVEQVLQREYAVVREGESLLSDLWFELQVRRISAQNGEPLSEALRQKVRKERQPPARIDFRSFNEM